MIPCDACRLLSVSLQRHTDLLEAAEVDMETLPLLTDQDLQVNKHMTHGTASCSTTACSFCSAQGRISHSAGPCLQQFEGEFKLGFGGIEQCPALSAGRRSWASAMQGTGWPYGRQCPAWVQAQCPTPHLLTVAAWQQ